MGGYGVDNPDQRIAEDTRAFTAVSLDFGISVLTALIDLVSFSGILYSIYPDLFAVVVAYAGFGTLCTVGLGKALGAQNAVQVRIRARAMVRVRVRVR